uniref:Uncharacterized protein n=1 Tax=Anguilla anguilla TaxID=7936 RepID=A0A0E9SA07_ANGAN
MSVCMCVCVVALPGDSRELTYQRRV